MSARFRAIAVPLLLLLGLQLWAVVGRGGYGSAPAPRVVVAVALVAAIPWVCRPVSRALDRIRRPSPRARRIATGCVFAGSFIYLVATGFAHRRELFPKLHDENMYLLQVQMLARGMLWQAPHPAADSFESFHIFTTPVYASMYFPGTALAYLPTAWLGLPYWLMPAMVAAGCVALLYAVTTELIDGLAGALAALLLLSLTTFRWLSLVMMSHTVLLLLGLGMVWGWLRWRRGPTPARAALLGAIGGWAAVTRPTDAICYALPIVAAMAPVLWKLPRRQALIMSAAALAAAAPFLALQVTMNARISGSLLRTPYGMYLDVYTPQSSLGFSAFDPGVRPQTRLAQRIVYYDEFNVPAARAHRPGQLWRTWTRERLPLMASATLPSPWLLILLPPAALALRGGRWVVPATLPLLAAVYALLPFFMTQYALIAAPAVIFAVVLGLDVVAASFPRARGGLLGVGVALVLLLALRAMPEFDRLVADDPFHMPTMTFNHRLAEMVRKPALVLYRFSPGDNPHEEPVYNTDVPWPDDAPVIRAHDLSPQQNLALFRHCAARQPDRHVYRVDRSKIKADPGYRPEYLGTVAALAAGDGSTSRPTTTAPSPL